MQVIRDAVKTVTHTVTIVMNDQEYDAFREMMMCSVSVPEAIFVLNRREGKEDRIFLSNLMRQIGESL